MLILFPQRPSEEEKDGKKHSRKDIPGPLQGSGQNMVSILQLVQNLMHEDEEEESLSFRRIQNVGEQGHMALLGHSLAAYISVLDRDRLRKLTTRILSDTTLWLCRLFRYDNGSAYYHEDDREGLLKVCRLVIHSRYEDYTTDGFNVFHNKQPVIYISAASRPGLGQSICNQLGLPLSCLCRVPCNTMFGSQHQMDVALLDRLIKDDIQSGKCPLLLVANAGTPGAGHTDKLGRLKELCDQYSIWLHVEGVNLATLALSYVNSSVLAATKCDSMTLTLGSWLGLPAVPAVTLYRHEDPSLSLAAGLTSSQPVEKLRALPLWLSLQYLGHSGIVEQIKHASQLSQKLLENLNNLSPVKTSVENDGSSPVVVFRFVYEGCKSDSTLNLSTIERDSDALNQYEQFSEEQDVAKREADLEKITLALLKKLNELETDLTFCSGPEFGAEKNCIYIGMASEDMDVSELVETITAMGREIEENSRLLENMTEVVRKGILEAEVQLHKANEERLLEEGVLRQIPLVGSMLNWLSPVQTTQKGRTFNLTAGNLETTETTYISKAQVTGLTPPPTPTSAHGKRQPGQKLFKRLSRNSDAMSETSSISHLEEVESLEVLTMPDTFHPATAENSAAGETFATAENSAAGETFATAENSAAGEPFATAEHSAAGETFATAVHSITPSIVPTETSSKGSQEPSIPSANTVESDSLR
ncbi:hypothetical protein XELAEV_18047506mg [Xenopus laevis]|uniref:Pyridoxal-dependent decarboxylase domain-containing protein 1 n=1 Tax=Xenopus laevis TaxID=8355 RepID=A0A974BVB5_XENLA|nr:hypothetical protein XELAEV_18047506mg [Xenopus laevis]